MYEKHREAFQFFLVYILEAHPVDGWRYLPYEKAGIRVHEPKSFEERKKLAATCDGALDVKFPILVDDMDNTAERAYAAWPERLYIVGKDGRVAYKSKVGSGGFKAADLAAELEKLPADKPR